MKSFDELMNEPLNIKVGDTVYLQTSFSYVPMKCHIMYILDSFYSDRKLIVYRLYGKHKQWWHEFMVNDQDFRIYREQAQKIKERTQ